MFRPRSILVLILLLATGIITLLEAQLGFMNRQPFAFMDLENEPSVTEFVFARLRFSTLAGSWQDMSGWEHDYPQAEQHINMLIQETTEIDVDRMSYRIVDMDDPDLFNYPFAYISEPGTMQMTEPELNNFREYLDRGGFVMVDDILNGLVDMSTWEWNLGRIYPDREMIPLTSAHPIFNTFYEITDLGLTAYAGLPDSPVFYGYPAANGTDLSMIICFNNDIGDYWEWLDQPRYPLAPSSAGVRLGINFFVYALTH